MKFLVNCLGFLLLMLPAAGSSQSKIEKQAQLIFEEGLKLYRSEMASWHGTDLFLKQQPQKRSLIRGYVSYVENSIASCVFYSETAKVIGTVRFDLGFNLDHADVDTLERSFTPLEEELFKIRTAVSREIENDTLFRIFENSNLNIIPLVEGEVKKAYVVTAPTSNGVVLLGNDYSLLFNADGSLKSKRRIHNSLIPIPYSREKEISMHTHVEGTSQLITATDICTLMLYHEYANWSQHLVISDKYVSIWDCKTKRLDVVTRKEWEKIYKDQKERE